MSKKRVHELAKEFGLENKDAIALLQAAGIQVGSHSSSVAEDEARAVLSRGKSPTAESAKKRPGMVIVRRQAQTDPQITEHTDPARDVDATPVVPDPVGSSVPGSASENDEETPSDDQAVAATSTPREDNKDSASNAPESEVLATGVAPLGPKSPVIRMIDREKLMERMPQRRSREQSSALIPPPSGIPTQKFGQVTELKIVTDPYGRGREIVDIDSEGKTAKKGVRKERVPTKREVLELRERVMHPARLKKKKGGKLLGEKVAPGTVARSSKRAIRMKEAIIVADLAQEMGLKVADILEKLVSLEIQVDQNALINFETAQLVASEFDFVVESTAFSEKDLLTQDGIEKTEDHVPRPPVVTVMGHVDHGKTSLLDAIRKSRVAAGEAGGITQHIGAYQVKTPKGEITFLDTPGHEAFTNMRARGANVTDIVVLVVAADDGVMPQTEEAIRHAQSAEVPIIVAINKMDRPEAQPDRVQQELSKFGLVPEAWGGETLFVRTSATKGTGVPELLETILLQAEVLELKANAKKPAIGVVIEAKLDKGRGPVATVLVQEGILRQGDAVVVGEHAGKVRAMTNDQGKMIKEAGPAMPVEVIGLEGVPNAGDTLNGVENADAARQVAEHRAGQKKTLELQQNATPKLSLEDFMKRTQDAEQLELKIVVKADVQGSVEALTYALTKLSTDEVKVKVIFGGVGGIKESDIMLAAATQGMVVGFGVRPDGNARSIAEREGVVIHSYSIIYECLDDVRKAMEGLLEPEKREVVVGRAEVRELFKIAKVGAVAGCVVSQGKVQRAARVRVLRDSVQVFDGKVLSLRHFKQDAREVEAGQECGVGIDGFNDIKPKDVLEFYQVESVARTLGPAMVPKQAAAHA